MSETNPKISVIVPVYNAEKYLEQCIKSIQRQTYENIEIILVDDGSTDSSGEICEEYCAKDKRIRVIHQANQGLVSTWRNGTQISEGNYLCYIDSDDWIDSEMLAVLANHLTGMKGEMVCSDLWLELDGEKKRESNYLKSGVYENEQLNGILQHKILGNENRLILASRCTKLIERSLIEQNMQYTNKDIRMGEDMSITLPALLDCKRLVIVSEAYYHYRQHHTSMIYSYDSQMYGNIHTLVRLLYKAMQDKEIADAAEMVKKEYIFFLILAIKNELRGGEEYQHRIKKICDANQEILRHNQVKTFKKSNKVILFAMKHPLPLLWWFLKQGIRIKER